MEWNIYKAFDVRMKKQINPQHVYAYVLDRSIQYIAIK